MRTRLCCIPQPVRLWLIMIYLLLGLTLNVEARVENVVVLDEYRRADLVLLVQIEQADVLAQEGTTCGIRYTASVREAFKTTPKLAGPNIVFGRQEGLMRGHRYILFLKYITDPLAYYETLRKRLDLPEQPAIEKQKDIERIKCGGFVPGLIYEARATWEVKLSYVIVDGIRPDIPNTVRFSSGGDLLWLFNKDDFFSYLRTLKAGR